MLRQVWMISNKNELHYISILSYLPKKYLQSITDKDTLKDAIKSIDIMRTLKQNLHVISQGKSIPITEWLTHYITHANQDNLGLDFDNFFRPDTVLIPVPRSIIIKKDTLWVPKDIATTFSKKMNLKMIPLLTRSTPVNVSSKSLPNNRPKPLDHFNSLSLSKGMDSQISNIVTNKLGIILVDDVITRGSTLMGCYWKILEIFKSYQYYPQISGFCAMRTISNSLEFRKPIDPHEGDITYRDSNGDTLRT